MARPDSKVAVTFIDHRTGETICMAQLEPGQLPETFEDLETTLHLEGQDWTVASAAPTTRSEYVKTGTLALRLHKVEKIDPQTLLFSLPSICNAIPGLSERLVGQRDYKLAEDDWRQFEFIDQQFAAVADEEIRSILRIHDEAKADVGWREIHVRQNPDPPITSTVELSDIVRMLGANEPLASVSYFGSKTTIIDGFSIVLSAGPTLYGLAPRGRVQVLALGQEHVGKYDAVSISLLAAVAQKYQLHLVQWCRCCRVNWDQPLFADLLSGKV
jgi:hypothetical protein